LSCTYVGERDGEYIQGAFDTNWAVPLGPNVTGFEIILITVSSMNVIVNVIFEVETFKVSILKIMEN